MHIIFTSWSLEGKITVSVVFWCILGLLNVVSQFCFLDCTWHNWHNLFCASRLRPAVEDPQADYTILFDINGLQIGWRNWFHPNRKNATLNLPSQACPFRIFHGFMGCPGAGSHFPRLAFKNTPWLVAGVIRTFFEWDGLMISPFAPNKKSTVTAAVFWSFFV